MKLNYKALVCLFQIVGLLFLLFLIFFSYTIKNKVKIIIKIREKLGFIKGKQSLQFGSLELTKLVIIWQLVIRKKNERQMLLNILTKII